MDVPLHEQLRSAWEASGLSLDELRERAGVACSSDSISRKLRNKQPMSTIECEALARALGVAVVAGAEHGGEAA